MKTRFFFISIIMLFVLDSLASNIKINSDNLVVNKKDLSAIFKGNVVLKFNDMKLSTKELRVFYVYVEKEKTIKNIIIPEKLTLLVNNNDDSSPTSVIADSGEFDNFTKKLTLKGNVLINQDDNLLSTDELVYKAVLESLNFN